MSVLTVIDNIPLFSTPKRALEWGEQFKLNGYHTHTFQNQVGYMGGPDHSTAVVALKGGVKRVVVRPTVVKPVSGGSSGGGY